MWTNQKASGLLVVTSCYWWPSLWLFWKKQTKWSNFMVSFDLRGWKHGLWLAHSSLENLPFVCVHFVFCIFVHPLFNTLCTSDTPTHTQTGRVALCDACSTHTVQTEVAVVMLWQLDGPIQGANEKLLLFWSVDTCWHWEICTICIYSGSSWSRVVS